jgi:hypothetical protein
MAAVDIQATERANNEMPGALLGRATKEKEPPQASEKTLQARESRASRSVTNRDLESFQRSRLASERAYEQRLKEQGLPPLAVLRAQAAAESKRFSEELARQRAEAEASERALLLQAQIAALNAQVNDLRSRSGEFSPVVLPDAFAFYGSAPFFGGRSRVNRSLFRVPFGVPIGGAFGSFNVPFGFSNRFHGFRRNIILPPGTRIGGRGPFRGGSHGPPRSR